MTHIRVIIKLFPSSSSRQLLSQLKLSPERASQLNYRPVPPAAEHTTHQKFSRSLTRVIDKSAPPFCVVCRRWRPSVLVRAIRTEAQCWQIYTTQQYTGIKMRVFYLHPSQSASAHHYLLNLRKVLDLGGTTLWHQVVIVVMADSSGDELIKGSAAIQRRTEGI